MKGNIQKIEPDADVIRLTEIVLRQNQMILEMNAKLLAALGAPRFIIAGEDK